jgi:hypothetical protein
MVEQEQEQLRQRQTHWQKEERQKVEQEQEQEQLRQRQTHWQKEERQMVEQEQEQEQEQLRQRLPTLPTSATQIGVTHRLPSRSCVNTLQ